MKTCTQCLSPQPLDNFHRNSKLKDGHVYYCKGCVKSNNVGRDPYRRDSTKVKDRVGYKKRISARVALVNELKLECGCSNPKCKWVGEFHPEQLHYHHIDPSMKSFSIAKGSRRGITLDKLLHEINKCELLCANCHAEHHYHK